ncbi:helix-turn-helix domain-containing protein [Alkalihalobacterium alkalinitrilicum]|uniref:helix-turn-helix domain-containing protein n=1 Tax=Alkalihalobacterium alkalinitrilicum TaxID=427920 RepID=UPI0013035D45|nr:helix-turn-helix domain-containing protein [Alkalihalobacterium alkalinitrilicum]
MNTEKKLMSLINSVRVLNSTRDLDKVLNQLIKEVLNVIEGSNASILFLYDKKINKLYAKTGAGFDLKYLKDILLKPGEGMSGKTFLSQRGRIFHSKRDTTKGMKDVSPKILDLYGKALSGFQYPASALCVPLISNKECIGVLTVDIYDKEIEFNEDDLKLLETFAVQATVAIENAMLFSGNERTKKMHEELSKVSLSQGGLTEITKTLSELIHCNVAVFNEYGDVLVSSSTEARKIAVEMVKNHPDLLHRVIDYEQTVIYEIVKLFNTKRGVYFFPIYADKYMIGLITIFLDEDAVLDPLDRFAVEQAAVIFALEMNRRESTAIEDLKYSGYILDQILHQEFNELSINQLSKLNIYENKDRKYISIKALINDPLLSFKEISVKKHQLLRLLYREISKVPFKSFVLDKNMELIFMFVFPTHFSEENIYKEMNRIFSLIEELAFKKFQLSILVGMGRIVTRLEEVKASYRDTIKCIDYLQTTNVKGSILAYNQLGIQRLFLKTEKNELNEYVMDTLGQIITYDKENDTELIPTLKCYLELNQNMAQTAKKMYVHTNTIKYRLKTINQILNLDSLDGRVAFDLQLALYIYEYLNI